MAAAVSGLSAAVKDQVRGVVLFGYTKNLQNRGAIPDFPADRTNIFCNVSDAVCWGTLYIGGAHFAYGADAAGAAPRWLIQQIGN